MQSALRVKVVYHVPSAAQRSFGHRFPTNNCRKVPMRSVLDACKTSSKRLSTCSRQSSTVTRAKVFSVLLGNAASWNVKQDAVDWDDVREDILKHHANLSF